MDYEDPLTHAFWVAAAEGTLTVQRCQTCGHYQFYPRPFCLVCDATKIEWVPVSGKGYVYSMTTVRVAIGPEFEPPYTVAIVELEEGPRLMTWIVDGDSKIGERVQLKWREQPDGTPMYVFTPSKVSGNEEA